MVTIEDVRSAVIDVAAHVAVDSNIDVLAIHRRLLKLVLRHRAHLLTTYYTNVKRFDPSVIMESDILSTIVPQKVDLSNKLYSLATQTFKQADKVKEDLKSWVDMLRIPGLYDTVFGHDDVIQKAFETQLAGHFTEDDEKVDDVYPMFLMVSLEKSFADLDIDEDDEEDEFEDDPQELVG